MAAALWAVAASVARNLFDSGVPPIELVQARALIGAVGLGLIPGAWRQAAKGAGSASWFHVVGLGLSIAAVNAAYYLAIERLAVAVAIVLQYTAPALVVAWVAVRTRRRPETVVLVALFGAVAGVVLASELLAGDIGTLDGVGIALGLAAAVMFATYTLLSQSVAAAYGPLGALARAFAVAALVWIVFQIPRGVPESLIERANIPEVLFVGIAGTILPFILYLWGITKVAAERAAIAATLEPVLAGVVAWIWLGQTLSPMQLAGGALALGAVGMLQARRREAVAPPDL